VVTLDLYQRQLPDYTDELLTRILLDQHYDAILALSGETVVNLVQLSRRAGASLATIPICVPSVRVAKVATQEGFKLPYVLPGTSASELAAALHKAPGFVSGPTDTEQETSNRDRH
jgi:uroporphyrinogen-III synthase